MMQRLPTARQKRSICGQLVAGQHGLAGGSAVRNCHSGADLLILGQCRVDALHGMRAWSGPHLHASLPVPFARHCSRVFLQHLLHFCVQLRLVSRPPFQQLRVICPAGGAAMKPVKRRRGRRWAAGLARGRGLTLWRRSCLCSRILAWAAPEKPSCCTPRPGRRRAQANGCMKPRDAVMRAVPCVCGAKAGAKVGDAAGAGRAYMCCAAIMAAAAMINTACTADVHEIRQLLHLSSMRMMLACPAGRTACA